MEHTPAGPIVAITGSTVAGLFRDVALCSPLKRIAVRASLLSSGESGTNARVRVIFETPRGRGALELGRLNYLRLILPTQPFRVRVEVYRGERLEAAREYEIQITVATVDDSY